MARWGKGFKMAMKLEGGEELAEQLARMGSKALEVVAKATHSGAEAVLDDIKADAPGPHIAMEEAKAPRGSAAVVIGPEKEHWHYQFFETGVQPFEINMVKRKSKRSTGRGRKMKGDKQAMKFGEIFAKRIERGPMAAKPFLRPNFVPKRDQIEDAFGDVIKREVL